MDETQSPGRDPQNRRRRRTTKTNNIPSSAQSEAQATQSPQQKPPSRNRGRNNGPARNGRSNERRSTTPDTPARSTNNASTPHYRRDSPAMRQAQVTETKFAGVFTNSPAASALPIPSFCVKPTTPQSPTPIGNHLHDSLDSQDDSEDSTQSSSDADTHESEPSPASPVTRTPAHVSVSIFDDHQDSPLDRIFRADREERQKALEQETSPSPRRNAPEPLNFTPAQLHCESRARNAFPKKTSPGLFNNTPASIYSRISPHELDGTPGMAMGPAFSTPYHQRISQARQASAATPPQPAAPDSTTDRSEALKRYLFGNSRKQPPTTEDSPKPQNTMHTPTKSPYESIYATVPSPRSPDLVIMEDNLRRILNLNPALDSNKIHEQPSIYS